MTNDTASFLLGPFQCALKPAMAPHLRYICPTQRVSLKAPRQQRKRRSAQFPRPASLSNDYSSFDCILLGRERRVSRKKVGEKDA